jgi:MOSC domain-containing protein YiiM
LQIASDGNDPKLGLMSMKVLSVSVGLPREVEWKGRLVLTSIYKKPVMGRVQARTLNLDGDKQSDLSVHGGPEKAVYVYPSEHYAFWRKQLPGVDLPWGVFGENLTTEGLDEQIRIGDRFRIGSAEFAVTQPRMPCFKLGIRFNDPGMIKRFLHSGRTGFYFSVVKEGEVGSGDAIESIARDDNSLTVADIVGLYATDAANQETLHRASELPSLPLLWRDYFRKRLWKPDN